MNLDKTKKITLCLSEREMNSIEDIFFCENTETQYRKMRPLLLRVWKKLCREMGK